MFVFLHVLQTIGTKPIALTLLQGGLPTGARRSAETPTLNWGSPRREKVEHAIIGEKLSLREHEMRAPL